MPAVIWCAIGFVAGDLAGLLWARGRAGWVWAGAAVLAALAARAWGRPGPRATPVAVILTAAAAGTVWGAAAAARAAEDCRSRWREGERLAVALRLWDVASAGGTSRAVLITPEGCAGALSVSWPSWITPPAAGGLVVGTWHRNPGAAGSVLPVRPARAGRLVARAVRTLPVAGSARAGLRLAAERRIRELFGAERAPLAAALTVGAGDQLDAAVRRRFARAGLAHVLAISGLHVGLLAGALVLALRLLRVGGDGARIGATALVALYVGLLGAPAPAVRALGLVALWALAHLRQRPPVPHAALAASALAVVVCDPLAAAEPGPWLSFAGAWGCVAASRQWSALSRERAVPRGRAGAVLAVGAVSAGATVATAPVSVLAFGTMAPAALLSNLLAVPLATFVVPTLALTLVLAVLAPPLAPLAAAAAGAGLDALDAAARLAGTLPLASLAVARRVPAALLLAAAGGILLRPLARRRRARAQTAARLALVAVLALAAWAWWPAVAARGSGDAADRLALHFLAVGQGDAAVLRTPAGRWIVVDGGPQLPRFDAGAAVVSPFLRRAGAARVALVVASHGDADHLGGLPSVIRAFRPDLVLEPGQPLPRPGYRRFLAAAARAGSRWHPARTGDAIALDGVALRVLHPDSAFVARRLPANEASVVLAVELGAFRALLTGDGGLPMEAAPGFLGRVPRATVLKVAHHGSRFATGAAFLAAVRPVVCVISVGPNDYGQPDPEVVARLEHGGCAVYRTDRDGAVTVETDGRTVRVRAARRDTTFTVTGGQP
jgi:competence protein ComEC